MSGITTGATTWVHFLLCHSKPGEKPKNTQAPSLPLYAVLGAVSMLLFNRLYLVKSNDNVTEGVSFYQKKMLPNDSAPFLQWYTPDARAEDRGNAGKRHT
jgi:hypothetical protein